MSKAGIYLLAAMVSGVLPFSALRAESVETVTIPHVSDKARESFRSSYLFADGHKAFAIAPGGAWSWRSEMVTEEGASQAAIEQCSKYTQQKCVLFAVNDQVVFDREGWTRLWGPYLDAKAAVAAPVGNRVGQRFYDLELTKEGKPVKLSELRGKVVLLHFWGSWCPPCCRELPSMQNLYTALEDQRDNVELVLAQVREPFAESKRWLATQKIRIPLYDSGVRDSEDEYLTLAGGKKISDRLLGKVFPTTYVLDKHGIVVFAHSGPIKQWPVYMPFLLDAVERSGK